MKEFNTTAYWEQRLIQNYNLAGVGFHSIGLPYNYWLYKVRRNVFNNILTTITCDFSKDNVLDIGSGTGHYIEIFKNRNVVNLTGIDITAIAVKQLSTKYPGTVFLQTDITDIDPGLATNQFQLVTIIDVLFHIIEDAKYVQALKNISRITKPGGYLILSENLCRNDLTRGHIRDRKKEFIISTLTDSGFEIIDQLPMFILMNPPSSSGNRVLQYFSDARIQLLKWVTHRHLTFIGHLVGMCLYPFEMLLHRVWPKNQGGPCTNFLICRKKSPG